MSAYLPRNPDYRQHVRESCGRGEVLRPGRNLTVCRGDAYALSDGSSKQVATILATMTVLT